MSSWFGSPVFCCVLKVMMVLDGHMEVGVHLSRRNRDGEGSGMTEQTPVRMF